MLALAACGCTPDGRITPDVTAWLPEKLYDEPLADPHAEPVADTIDVAGDPVAGAGGPPGTRPTLVVMTAGGAPALVGAAGGVLV